MDATVAAAAIGVGGTVLVGVAGFGASVWNTRKTIEHDSASRVWERRADVYVEALAAVEYLQVTHGTLRDWSADVMWEFASSHEEPAWQDLDTRMMAFASEPVWELMQGHSKAYARLPSLLPPREPRRAAQAKEVPLVAPFGQPAETAKALSAVVIDKIRSELQSGERRLSRRQQRISPLRRPRVDALFVFDEESRSD